MKKIRELKEICPKNTALQNKGTHIFGVDHSYIGQVITHGQSWLLWSGQHWFQFNTQMKKEGEIRFTEIKLMMVYIGVPAGLVKQSASRCIPRGYRFDILLATSVICVSIRHLTQTVMRFV